ncbi:MAG: phosphoadenosine phosphosulfate reductase [Desulfurococcales archaeon ex4484_58]|nr:MAG: phosphoadenosine phosphosulfate reductase [Desulfurococcales archaeon ex4484_58]
MRRIWPKIAKIYWDPDYNIPVVKPKHHQVDLFYVLKLTEPGDARPGFKRDYERLEESIEYEFGDEKLYNEWFRGQFILMNKVPHWDQMWEVVSSGNVWGQLYYDPFTRKWKFRLTYSGAYYAYHNRLVEYIRVSSPIKKKQSLGIRSISSRQAVIVNEQEEILGLAENIGGKFIVTKTFKGGKPPIEVDVKRRSLEDVLKYNEDGIEWYKGHSINFLTKLYKKNPLPIVVSYSGGKDSLVALHLTLEALGEADLLFNDTGLELPETIKNVEYVAKRFGLNLVRASAGNAFWETVSIFGPPGKDYRWCCKIIKLVPIAKTTRVKWGSGALNIVGQRAYESIDRAKSPIVWRNRWVPHLLTTTPIQEWNQLVLWLYIYKYKLPYNPLYDIGYERLGCYLCPASTLAEFGEVEKRYPCLWKKWLDILEYWRDKLHQPCEWITLGLWRWLTPAIAKYRLVKHIGNYNVDWRREYMERLLNSKVNLTPIRANEENNNLEVIFNRKLFTNRQQIEVFKTNMKMLDKEFIENNNELLVRTKDTLIHIIDNKILVEPYENVDNLEDLVDVVKIIYRIHGCSRCGSCILWCPYKIVKLTKAGPKPDPLNKCSGCRICLEVCPVSEVLVEKVVVPLIINDPRAWSRPSRRRAEEYSELLV